LNHVWVLALAAMLVVPSLGGASQEQVVEVRIVQGDTLRAICQTYLENPGDWREIARINRLANPNVLVPGQILIIPVRMLKAAPSEGTVGFLRGKAEIRPPGSTEWRPISAGDRIPQGSVVRTLEGSALEIVFENGDSCFLRPDTTLGMTTATKEGDTWVRKVFLQVGKIITRIQKATGTQSRFEVSTPSAQCAARGTVFRASADTDALTRSEVLEGTVSVEAMGVSVNVLENQGTAVKKGEAPLPPRTLLPGPVPLKVESPYRKMPFVIEFGTAAGTVSTLAALTKDRAGQDSVLESFFKPGQPFRVAGLEDGIYYLQSRSIDDLGLEGIPAPPLEIRIRTEPRPPRLQGISSGAKLRCGPPSVRWVSVPGAGRYHLQLAGDQGFALISDQADTSQTAWTSTRLAMGDYYLRARSIADDGYEGEWSEILSFSVLPPYAPPVLEKPARDQGQIRLRWNDLGPGVLYRVQAARGQDFRVLVHQELVRTTETFIPVPAQSGLYYVQVKAFDGEGCESAFSIPQKFRVGGFWSFILTPCWLTPLGILIYLLAR